MGTHMVTEWLAMLPELWVGLLAAALLALDLRWRDTRPSRYGLIAAVGLLPVFPLLLWQAGLGPREILSGMYRIDALALFFKALFTAAAVLVILMTRELSHTLEKNHGEFVLLILTALLGMLYTASSADFLMLFVSLELIAITFYVLTSYLMTDVRSLEAGMKYLVLGSLSSGIFLFGVAFVYGAVGTTSFSGIQAAVRAAPALPPGLLFGLVLMLAGILFKVAGVPFQLWVPDVYQGAPTPVTAFLSVGSKAAGFLVAFRVLSEIFGPHAPQWSPIVAWLAGLTILYGNLGAIPQRNMKRLLGYSSIGHAGYLLIGIAVSSAVGAAAVNFYLLGYLFSNLAIFLVLACFYRHAGSDEIRDYAGLAKRSPFLAAVMFLALLSLAGVPPLVGFMGKFLLLLSAVWEGYFWLAAIGAAAVVISLYYYLLIVKVMYADEPADPSPIPVSFPARLALLACIAGMLGIGLWQAPFLSLSFAAVKSLF